MADFSKSRRVNHSNFIPSNFEILQLRFETTFLFEAVIVYNVAVKVYFTDSLSNEHIFLNLERTLIITLVKPHMKD